MFRRATTLTIWLLVLLPAASFARGGSGSSGFRAPSFSGGGHSYYGQGFGRGFGGSHFIFIGGGGGGGGGLLLLIIVVVVLVMIFRGPRRRRRRW